MSHPFRGSIVQQVLGRPSQRCHACGYERPGVARAAFDEMRRELDGWETEVEMRRKTEERDRQAIATIHAALEVRAENDDALGEWLDTSGIMEALRQLGQGQAATALRIPGSAR